MERKKVLLGLISALFLATSTLGFIISFGSVSGKNFRYSGECTGVIKEIRGTYWLVYTLRDVNIPGERSGPYIRTIPTDYVRKVVRENDLLYWKNALVDVNLHGSPYTVEAFVLSDRNVGDRVLLQCDVAVQGGRVISSNAIEIPEGA